MVDSIASKHCLRRLTSWRHSTLPRKLHDLHVKCVVFILARLVSTARIVLFQIERKVILFFVVRVLVKRIVKVVVVVPFTLALKAFVSAYVRITRARLTASSSFSSKKPSLAWPRRRPWRA